MPPRYRITLEAASTGADYEEAASTLEVLTGAKRGEVEYWLRNLPHTITGSASESKGRNLMDTFSSLGFEMGCSPALPPLSHEEKTGHKEYQNLDFNISSAGSTSSKKGLYLTLAIITVIIFSFAVSLFIAMKMIQVLLNTNFCRMSVEGILFFAPLKYPCIISHN